MGGKTIELQIARFATDVGAHIVLGQPEALGPDHPRLRDAADHVDQITARAGLNTRLEARGDRVVVTAGA